MIDYDVLLRNPKVKEVTDINKNQNKGKANCFESSYILTSRNYTIYEALGWWLLKLFLNFQTNTKACEEQLCI